MDIKYINAVSKAVEHIFANHFCVKTSPKKPWAGKYEVESKKVSVIIGIHGQLSGQIITSFDTLYAQKMVGAMMGGVEVKELDRMAWSAIQEFGNWIAGTVATELSKVGAVCDVTTPVVNEGDSTFHSNNVFITLPIETEFGEFQIHVSIKESL